MGIGVSLILIAVGAVLAFAVTSEGGSVDPQTVGVILMVVGLAGLIIDILLLESWGPGYLRRRRVAYGDRGYATDPAPAPRRRTTVVEEEVDGRPAGPPPP
jgi:hypothetical protein